MIIELNQTELKMAKLLAKERTNCNRSRGIKDQKKSKRSGAAIEFDGICGELAVCKAFNIYPHISDKPERNSNDGVIKGKTIEVKTTGALDGSLLVRPKEEKKNVDYFILVLAEAPYFHIAGFLESRNVFKTQYIRNPMNLGKAFFIPQDVLKPIEDFPV